MEYTTRLRAVSRFCFFLVCRAKRARHENDHAREWRPETKVGCKTVRIFEHDARTVKQKVWCEAEEGERDWGETLNYLSHLTRVRFALFRVWGSHATLTLHKPILRKKTRLFCGLRRKRGGKREATTKARENGLFWIALTLRTGCPSECTFVFWVSALNFQGPKPKFWPVHCLLSLGYLAWWMGIWPRLAS